MASSASRDLNILKVWSRKLKGGQRAPAKFARRCSKHSFSSMWTASQHSKTIEILFWGGRELESLSLHRTYSTESCGKLLFTHFGKLLDFSRVPLVVSITCKKLQNTGSSANEATDRRPRSRQRMIYRTSSFQCNIFVVGPIFSGALCPPLTALSILLTRY